MEGEQLPPIVQSIEPEVIPKKISANLRQATSEIPEIWGVAGTKATRNLQLMNIRRSQGLLNTTHGMYAAIPMICKGMLCPFRGTCWIEANDLIEGDRCPIEIATIMQQYENYCRELSIQDDEIVDQSLVRQLIDLEIQMMRADSKLATSPDIVKEVVGAINQRTGDVYYKDEINPVVELKGTLRQQHHRVLNQLQATRKDKKDELLRHTDPSSMAAALISRVRQMDKGDTNKTIIIDNEATVIGEATMSEQPFNEVK